MKKEKRNLLSDLCQTIADQNGLIYEVGGDSGEGYFIKFGTPSNMGYFIEYVKADPTKDTNDILSLLPEIYRAIKNLLLSRVDMLNNNFNKFMETDKNNTEELDG